MKRKNLEMVTDEKQAAVNIDAELQELIKKLVILSVQKGLRGTDVISAFYQERREYVASLIRIPEESEDEKQFRVKTKKFFEEVVEKCGLEETECGFMWRDGNSLREFTKNSGIEIICAGYKLYTQNQNINQNNIYETAKDRMPEKKGRGTCWMSKRHRMRYYLDTYIPHIIEKQFKDTTLRKKCDDFLKQFDYRINEKMILEMIFLINDYNS